MIITKPNTTHFHSDVFIENLDDCLNKQPALLSLIAMSEMEALKMVLGECLYDEFSEQFEYVTDDGWVLKEDSHEKWKWLLNGRAYEFDGVRSYGLGCGCVSANCDKIKFNGIVNEIMISDVDFIEKNYLAYYIYYQFKTINESVTAGTGEQVPNTINSMTVYNKKKRYNAWNRFVDWYLSVLAFLRHHAEYFPSASPQCGALTYKNIFDL